MFKNFAKNQLFKALDKIKHGTIVFTAPDGKVHTFSGDEGSEKADIQIHDWRVISNMVRKGDIGFAEDYRDGRWESSDLVALTTIGLKNRQAMQHMVTGNDFFRMISSFSYLMRLNTIKGSKKNIHEHYDLGNDFYKLWLDPSMTYSSAIFGNDNNLLDAQNRKYDRILDCLDNKSGKTLEIGCGWGGFAERAVSKGDYNVRGITLSEEQHEYANDRLGKDAKIVLEDYRHQKGKFDNIVSIEMFEAVGEGYWPTYFSQVKNLLHKKGRAVIQTITINEGDFENYRKGGDFIRTYIFPGGMLPSESRFAQEANKVDLRVGEKLNFGMDYAKTLEMWLARFDEKIEQIKTLGYDEKFIRMWRFYLAACAAGFKSGRTDVMQVELSHA